MTANDLIKEIASMPNIQTPYYLFDLDLLKKQISKIKKEVKQAKLIYAMKANPLLVSEMKELVDAFEVCSPGEYRICQKQQISNDKIILSGVYKNYDDIEMIMKQNVQPIYTVESLQHLLILDTLSKKYQKEIKVLLRLTSGNQFGLDEADINKILAQKEHYSYLKWEGIQFYSGTQKKPSKMIKELNKMKTFIETLVTSYDVSLNVLEFGPGLPIHYFQKQEDDSLKTLNDNLETLAFSGTIALEIGRYMVASCGRYVTKVVDTKENHHKNYAILDGGIHHVNYYGQFLGMKHPFITHLKTTENKEEKEWELCGSLCTVADVLVKDMSFNGLQQDDLLIFEQVGAYSITESIFLFLSRDMPQVLFNSKQNGIQLVRDTIQTDTINTVKEQL